MLSGVMSGKVGGEARVRLGAHWAVSEEKYQEDKPKAVLGSVLVDTRVIAICTIEESEVLGVLC